MVIKTLKKYKYGFPALIAAIVGFIIMIVWVVMTYIYDQFMKSVEYTNGEKIIVILLASMISILVVSSVILFIELKEVKNDIIEETSKKK